jgi:hypothetical protein
MILKYLNKGIVRTVHVPQFCKKIKYEEDYPSPISLSFFNIIFTNKKIQHVWACFDHE